MFSRKIKYIAHTSFAGALDLSPNFTGNIRMSNGNFYSFNDNFSTAWFHNSKGFIIRHSISLNLIENPFSPVADFSFSRNQLNLVVTDSNYHQLSRSRIRNINLFTLGIGGEINRKYLTVGAKYRVGHLSNGKHRQALPVVPEIVKNNSLNKTTSV